MTVPTIVATAGSGSANSYATLDESAAYHDTHLYASTWNDASTADQTIALIWATRLLDQHFTWSGSIASQTQALSWPRAATYDRDGRLLDSAAIPAALRDATCELARSLIAGDRTDSDSQTGAISYVTVGQIAVKYSAGTVITQTVIPDAVQAMVAHLGAYANSTTGGAVTLRRA